VSFVVGTATEYMMVVWTVAMARNIRPDALARVSGYDGLGSMMATPVGALIAGPAATHYGVRQVQFVSAALIAAVSTVAALPRDVRTRRQPAAAVEAAVAEAESPAAVVAAGP
jgi:predicted MFS family arabinose efflux permease